MVKRSPQVTVVIVTYQSMSTIGATLDGLFEAFNSGVADTVVVDNASTDGTADFVEKNYSWAHLVRNNKNVGFGSGCNIGFEHANTPYILLLNPDAVLNRQALMTLVDFMNGHPRAGICGPAVREASGVLQPSGGQPTPWKIMLKPILPGWASRGQRHVTPGEPPSKTDWICGSVMLIRKRLIDEIGPFDPRFFLYFEETDLICRAIKSGWEIWTVGESVAEHVNAASAKITKKRMSGGTISEHYFKSRFYFMIKHYGWLSAVLAEVGELAFLFVRALIDLPRGKTNKKLWPRLCSPFLKLPSKV